MASAERAKCRKIETRGQGIVVDVGFHIWQEEFRMPRLDGHIVSLRERLDRSPLLITSSWLYERSQNVLPSVRCREEACGFGQQSVFGAPSAAIAVVI
jgi:hypothetical protein